MNAFYLGLALAFQMWARARGPSKTLGNNSLMADLPRIFKGSWLRGVNRALFGAMGHPLVLGLPSFTWGAHLGHSPLGEF